MKRFGVFMCILILSATGSCLKWLAKWCDSPEHGHKRDSPFSFEFPQYAINAEYKAKYNKYRDGTQNVENRLDLI